jgi:hypothetical protein
MIVIQVLMGPKLFTILEILIAKMRMTVTTGNSAEGARSNI